VVFLATAQRDKEKQLQRDVTRLVEGSLPGVDVLAVEMTGKERFCVFVDHPQGVDHALCERVSNVLRSYLDEYSVEVSSPGFERPLRTRDHFAHAVGRNVRIKTETGKARGEVLSAGETSVRISSGTDSENAPHEIPYEQIVRANMIDEG
jgi:ribosome maturation factor RimP